MDSIRDIIEGRVESLGSDTYDVMTEVKLVITDIVKAEVRVLSVSNGTVKVATEDASAASEIRLNKQRMIKELKEKKLPIEIQNIVVVIR